MLSSFYFYIVILCLGKGMKYSFMNHEGLLEFLQSFRAEHGVTHEVSMGAISFSIEAGTK